MIELPIVLAEYETAEYMYEVSVLPEAAKPDPKPVKAKRSSTAPTPSTQSRTKAG